MTMTNAEKKFVRDSFNAGLTAMECWQDGKSNGIKLSLIGITYQYQGYGYNLYLEGARK